MGYNLWGRKASDTTEQLTLQPGYDIPSRYPGSPCGSAGKESACNAGDLGSIPESGRAPGGGQPTPAFLPGESPRTEEPGGLPSMDSQSRTRLSD